VCGMCVCKCVCVRACVVRSKLCVNCSVQNERENGQSVCDGVKLKGK